MPLAPGAGAGAGTGTDPRFTFDEDGWWDVVDGCGINGGDGPTKDCECNDCVVFCFFRDAETVGLGNGS